MFIIAERVPIAMEASIAASPTPINAAPNTSVATTIVIRTGAKNFNAPPTFPISPNNTRKDCAITSMVGANDCPIIRITS